MYLFPVNKSNKNVVTTNNGTYSIVYDNKLIIRTFVSYTCDSESAVVGSAVVGSDACNSKDWVPRLPFLIGSCGGVLNSASEHDDGTGDFTKYTIEPDSKFYNTHFQYH